MVPIEALVVCVILFMFTGGVIGFFMGESSGINRMKAREEQKRMEMMWGQFLNQFGGGYKDD